MKRALLVAAVSTRDRQQDPESQLRPLRATAERHGWEYEEKSFKQSRWDDESAAEVRAAIMAKLRGGTFDILAVWGWDRISRRGADEALSFLGELEQHLGVRFFSLQEPFLCTGASQETRELLLPLIAWNAKWDSQRKSDRIVAKAESKRISSGKLGKRAVWGGGRNSRLATPDQVIEIRRLRAVRMLPDGRKATERAISRHVGVSKSQVHRILSGEVKSLDPDAAPLQNPF